MELNKKIKALSMLLIMGFVAIHNAFPHIHHQHTFESAVLAVDPGHHHHHDHDHDDHHHHSNGDDDKSLLGSLFENHSHSSHSHRYAPVTVETTKSSRVQPASVFCIPNNSSIHFPYADTGLHRYDLFDHPFTEHPYFLSNSLRAPPSLG